MLETNLRFDTPDNAITRARHFLEALGYQGGTVQVPLTAPERRGSTASYLSLFYQFRAARGFSAPNLTFQDLEGLTATPHDISLCYAD